MRPGDDASGPRRSGREGSALLSKVLEVTRAVALPVSGCYSRSRPLAVTETRLATPPCPPADPAPCDAIAWHYMCTARPIEAHRATRRFRTSSRERSGPLLAGLWPWTVPADAADVGRTDIDRSIDDLRSETAWISAS